MQNLDSGDIIQNMQKIFRHIAHRRSKVERFFLILSVYLLFWCVFYGSYIILPQKFTAYIGKHAGIVMSVYVLLFVPLISLLIPRHIVRYLKAKPWFVYSVHVFVLFLSIVAFFTLSLWRIYNSLGPEDFVS